MNAKITVVVTTFNSIDTIEGCLSELINQSFQDFNVLVFDDCSTDNTCCVIDKYREKFGNRLITIYSRKNNGSPGAARNAVLDLNAVSGEYLIFLDGDDNIESNMIERLYYEAKGQNADVVCCGYTRVNAATNQKFSTEMVDFYVQSITQSDNLEYIPLINGSLWNKLIRTKCIDNIRFAPIRIGEDACFLLDLYRNVNKIVFIDDVLIRYNVYEKSLMSNVSVDEAIKLSEKLKEIYSNSPTLEYRSMVVLSVFIHIGISVCTRIYQSSRESINQHIRWTKKHLNDNYPNWYKTPCLKMKFLKNLGIKGFAIKVCVYLYRMNLFKAFLILYTFMIKIIGKDVKW